MKWSNIKIQYIYDVFIFIARNGELAPPSHALIWSCAAAVTWLTITSWLTFHFFRRTLKKRVRIAVGTLCVRFHRCCWQPLSKKKKKGGERRQERPKPKGPTWRKPRPIDFFVKEMSVGSAAGSLLDTAPYLSIWGDQNKRGTARTCSWFRSPPSCSPSLELASSRCCLILAQRSFSESNLSYVKTIGVDRTDGGPKPLPGRQNEGEALT